MDSLFANYASSDEEEDQQQQKPESPLNPTSKPFQPSTTIIETPKTSSLLSSLPKPKPKSSSLFLSLPQPKSSPIFPSLPEPNSSSISSSLPEPKSSSVFSSLPPPKLHNSNPIPPTNLSSSNPNPKKVIQFKPPINPLLLKSHDVEDEEEEEEEKRKSAKKSASSSEAPTVKSFISSLPVPKNSLGMGAPPSLGSGRRSIIQADSPITNSDGPSLKSDEFRVEIGIGSEENLGNYEGNWVDGSSLTTMGIEGGQLESATSGGDPPNWLPNNESYGNYENYGNYEGNWVDGSTTRTTTPEISGMVERRPGKRGRTEIPLEIVEVKQDELIKNRPREDQIKSTGIAFGPSYQPVSSKGKPSKLHKRKHQIGSLYFDMKQKETELSERRSKGFLTKAETQAKYGW